MAYMDEMALEREKSRQAMIAGKTPMFGADTTAAMHQLGISLGVIPPGTPPSQTTQVLEGLLKGGGLGKIKVDEATPLQVPTLAGRMTASLAPHGQADDGTAATLGNIFKGASDSALQQMLRNQQRQQGPVGPASPTAAAPPGTNRARLAPRERAPEGPTYKADVAYLNERGGHASVVKDGKIVSVPLDTPGAYQSVDPELAARLRAAGEAYEKETGKKAQFGEFSRGEDVQAVYWKDSAGGTKYAAAPPGRSRHQTGAAGDLPAGGFRDWLNAGNKDKYGVHFPVKGDAPHVEVNPANKQSYSNPTGTAPAADAQPRQGGSAVLAEQRKPVAQYLDSNPSAKEQMAAAAYTEDNNSREGRIAVHEAAANRIVANGRPVSDVIDPKYYAAMNDPAQRAKYDAALAKVKSDPEFRKQLFGEIDQAHKRGTNYAKLATDFASSTSADKSRTNSTSVGKVGGNEFFIKDQHPEVHGAGTVANNKKWLADTQAALAKPTAAPAAAAEPTATAPASTQAPAQAAAQPVTPAASAAEPPKADATVAPQASSQQLGPSGEEPLQPEPTPAQNTQPSAPPASVAVPSTPAPAAAAPVPPPVAAPPVAVAAKPAPPAPPPKPAAPPVNPAHALLDTSVYELAKKSSASEAAQVKMFLGDKMTLREAMKHPMYGGMATSKARENLGKAGITPQQFDQAVKEGQPKPTTLGKRSDLGTSDATDFSARKRIDPNAPTLDPASQPAYMDPASREISTVRTMGIGEDGKRVNIPTVPAEGGRLMSDEEAIQRYKDTGKHLGKFDTKEQSNAAAEALHQNEAAQIDTRDKGPQPVTPPPPPQPQLTPEMAKSLLDAFKDQSRVEPGPPPSAGVLPVLPVQPVAPTPGPGNGGLSLAPAGLSSIPTGALPTGAPGSQGGGIAMAGMLPPIQNSTYSTPLLDQTAATAGSGMGLSPIPLQTLGSWGWGGGSIGAGLDWGGGAPEVPMGAIGGFD